VYPLPLLLNITKNEEHRKGAGKYSATTLQGCPRQVILMRQSPYAEDPEEYLPRFFGTLGHDTMYQELKDEGGAIAETRFYKSIDVDGVVFEVSGKMDWVLLDYQGGTMVVDFKNAGKRVKGMTAPTREEHVLQAGGVYPWLLDGGRPEFWTPAMEPFRVGDGVKIVVDQAEIDYFFTGSPRQTQKVKVPVMDPAFTEAYLRDRLRPFLNYETAGVLPPILPSTYVQKRNGTTEVKRHWMCNRCPVRALCDALDEAERSEDDEE
jgi:hypothetical protein